VNWQERRIFKARIAKGKDDRLRRRPNQGECGPGPLALPPRGPEQLHGSDIERGCLFKIHLQFFSGGQRFKHAFLEFRRTGYSDRSLQMENVERWTLSNGYRQIAHFLEPCDLGQQISMEARASKPGTGSIEKLAVPNI
jgi:hypothetical protein